MAKAKSAYVCGDCGSEYSKWQGQCADCGAWSTITEVKLASATQRGERLAGYAGAAGGEVQTLDEIDLASIPRQSTGLAEFARRCKVVNPTTYDSCCGHDRTVLAIFPAVTHPRSAAIFELHRLGDCAW